MRDFPINSGKTETYWKTSQSNQEQCEQYCSDGISCRRVPLVAGMGAASGLSGGVYLVEDSWALVAI